jgi:hypothetical protein
VPAKRGAPGSLLPHCPAVVSDSGQLYKPLRPENPISTKLANQRTLALLLTYGRITDEALCQGIITKTVKPLQSPPDPMPKALSVRYRGIVWSIPVHECETWFVCRCTRHTASVLSLITTSQSFVSHFRNYQPRRLRFFNHARVVRPKDWSKFYLIAVRSQRKLVLDLQLK